jgi:hypothetical protein
MTDGKKIDQEKWLFPIVRSNILKIQQTGSDLHQESYHSISYAGLGGERRAAMSAQLPTQERGNEFYQRDLAEKLVTVLGFDEALGARRNNVWEGVLAVLLRGGVSKVDRAAGHGRR